MVTKVVMTVQIRLVQGSEKVKHQDVDEAHGNSEVENLVGCCSRIMQALSTSIPQCEAQRAV